jgi:hypothetical protein
MSANLTRLTYTEYADLQFSGTYSDSDKTLWSNNVHFSSQMELDCKLFGKLNGQEFLPQYTIMYLKTSK